MSVQATCFHCQHANSFADKWAGRVMRCQKCGGILTLPKLDVPATPRQDLETVAQSRQPAAPIATFPATDPRQAPVPSSSFATTGAPKPFPKPVAVSPKAPAATVEKAPGSIASWVCGVNGVIVLLVGAAAALIALPQTRPMILDKLHATPTAGPEVAWGVAGAALLLGGFYLVCALRMNRAASFARFAAIVALAQSALQIAALVYMTLQGKLDLVLLGFITVSLIALCGLVDLAIRTVRATPARKEVERRAAIDADVQPGLV